MQQNGGKALSVKDHVIDPAKYFIVCANIIGSCYGTTGPLSINPATNEPYYDSFPLVTIRDMVKAHILLREHLGIEKIFLVMGGSMGGYQAMEWCVMEKHGHRAPVPPSHFADRKRLGHCYSYSPAACY